MTTAAGQTTTGTLTDQAKPATPSTVNHHGQADQQAEFPATYPELFEEFGPEQANYRAERVAAAIATTSMMAKPNAALGGSL